jgi:hypothetical protein
VAKRYAEYRRSVRDEPVRRSPGNDKED